MEVLFVGGKTTTAQLRTAGYNLNRRCHEMSLMCRKRVADVNPEFSPETLSYRVRRAMSPGDIPLKHKERWGAAETMVAKDLHHVGLYRHPGMVKRRISEKLLPLPAFSHPIEAINFLDFTAARLDHLRDATHSDRFDTLSLLAYNYTESVVLRTAIYEGVYLVRPPARITTIHDLLSGMAEN